MHMTLTKSIDICVTFKRAMSMTITLTPSRSSAHLLGLAREAPPDYSTACKQKEEEEEEGLPSYSQAVGRGSCHQEQDKQQEQEQEQGQGQEQEQDQEQDCSVV